MKLFPNKNYTIELRDDRKVTLDKLRRITELKDNIVSSHTDKEFIGQISDSGFKIISSEIGRGSICVFIGELQDSFGNLEIRLHTAFKVMFSILMLTPIIGFGIVLFNSGIEKSIAILFPLIIGLLFIRFVFIELSFKFISKTGINKLYRLVGIKVQ